MRELNLKEGNKYRQAQEVPKKKNNNGISYRVVILVEKEKGRKPRFRLEGSTDTFPVPIEFIEPYLTEREEEVLRHSLTLSSKETAEVMISKHKVDGEKELSHHTVNVYRQDVMLKLVAPMKKAHAMALELGYI